MNKQDWFSFYTKDCFLFVFKVSRNAHLFLSAFAQEYERLFSFDSSKLSLFE